MGRGYEDTGHGAEVKYEKLSKRALHCMYLAGIIGGIIVLAVIGAVNAFWLFPEDVTVGKWISLALVVRTFWQARISGITATGTASMRSA